MSKKISRESFKLVKAKLVTGKKSCGLEFTYLEVLKNGDGSTHERRVSEENTQIPMPSLIEVFDKFKPMLSSIMDYDYGRTLMVSDGFKGTKAQSEQLEEAISQIVSRLKVYGAVVSGVKNGRGIILNCQKRTASNSCITFNTPRMKFTDTSTGYEQDASDLWDELESEVYKYAIENQYAQQELFDPADDNESDNDGSGEE